MIWWKNALLLAGFGLFSDSAAFPFSADFDDAPFNASHPFEEYGKVISKRADKVALRILPLGASIMNGIGSSNGNGLRKPLRDAFRFEGYEVDMVGTQNTGPMKDNDNEAVPGDTLTQIRTRLQRSLGYKANIIIINAGTNDAVRKIATDKAGERLNDMLNDIWGAEDSDGACIFVSTLLDTTDKVGQVERITINQQYRDKVTERAEEGKCIYLADMDPPEGQSGHGWISFETDYKDGENPQTHPNDKGHAKMAFIFYEAIHKALKAGKVLDPQAGFSVEDPVCEKFAGEGIYPGGKTQRGTGWDDDVYYHNSKEMGIIWTAESDWDRDQWHFARLFDSKYDDFLAWIKKDKSNVFAVWANSADGKGDFKKLGSDISPGLSCDADGIYFLDMNNDGLDDLVCISSNGDASLSINNGDGNRGSGKPPSFKSIGKIKSNEGKGRGNVIMADIDGDGRGDYGVIDKLGTISFWRNGWVDDKPKYWQPLGTRWTDKYTRDIKGVKFRDINGDGRDDWLWVDKEGATTTFTNSRSCGKGKEGDGLKVAWRQGYFVGEGTGPTHKGMKSYMTSSEKDLRKRIHFARVYGGSSSFGNLPLQDYVFLQHETLKNKKHRFQMRVWKNTGGGASKLKVDGDRYCNMVGHEDGRADYVWMWSNGKMELFINRGKKSITDDDSQGWWDWTPGVIWTPPEPMHRQDLHLADWNGDGACDILYVNPKNNQVRVFINPYPKTGKWDGWGGGVIYGFNCDEKRGTGIHDLAVRFADLTGNNRADFLCLAPDGKVSAYLHGDDDRFDNVGQIKVAEGHDRAMLRWADVDGDGKDDFLWIEKFSGDTWVWYNDGRGDREANHGSAFHWRQQKEMAYAGLAAGTCLFYADLNGDGRADEHYILESFNNIAETSLSPPCGLTNRVDDAENVPDPQLPVRESDGKEEDNTDGSICSYTFSGTTPTTLKATWINSGARQWFSDFIDAKGVKNWSNKFFQAITGDGGQGGSTVDCTTMFSTSCTGPGTKACKTYDPNEAFFVHLQVGNMYAGYNQWYNQLVNTSIIALSSGIKDVVNTYGDPGEDDNSVLLNMLVGIFTSLAGIAGTLGQLMPLVSAGALLTGAVNPLTAISGVIAIGAAQSGSTLGMDPKDLEDGLETAYGQMFAGISNALQTTIENVFKGTTVEDKTDADMPQWIKDQFEDGAWLSKEMINDMIKAYSTNTEKKFLEFALIRAMKTENRHKYLFFAVDSSYKNVYFRGDPYSNDRDPMTREACEWFPGTLWHDEHCLAFGYIYDGAMPYRRQLPPDEIEELKGYIQDYDAALINNYECAVANGVTPKEGKMGEPVIPSDKDFDPTNLMEYPPCFFNLGLYTPYDWQWGEKN